MEDWMTLIELVDSTSDRKMCYLVALLDDEHFNPNSVGCGEEGVCEMEYFSTAEEAIKFLSDKELFGWIPIEWGFTSRWNDIGEMRIELYRREK